MIIKTDCLYYKGDIPCRYHKKYGFHCENCQYYSPIKNRILIIKLGAIGDVLRTSPLLRRIRKEYNNVEISWLTYSPSILSSNWVDNILDVSIENIEWLRANNFDWLINLDKDKLAISLTKNISAKKKSGFLIDKLGKCKPISNKPEEHKWLTGLWDNLSKKNRKNYIQEIFEICGFEFQNEEYVLDLDRGKKINWDIDKEKKVVGLNTGCGGRWESRLWPLDYWIELASKLIKNDFEVILLGGEQEDEKNKRISRESGVKYFGHFKLETFINLVNQVELVVTAVTMAMHLAIGLKKKLVLFNNIFNKNEFYLYNRGVILEPEMECDCFFSPECPNNCMQYLYPETVLIEIDKLLKK